MEKFLKNFFWTSLFIIAIFSFFACKVESSDSSISLTVFAPTDSSEHGYMSGDLSSCLIEIFGYSGSHFSSFGAVGDSFSFGNLRGDTYVVQAYGYDKFGTAIANSEPLTFSIDDDESVSKDVQLEWRESGKPENQSCYVRFDTDGGTAIQEQKVKSGSTVTEPTAPTKSGYSLEGWYWDSSRNVRFDFSEPISWGITLHAKWIEGEDNPNSDDENSDDKKSDDDNNSDDSKSDDDSTNNGENSDDSKSDDDQNKTPEEPEESKTKGSLEISVSLPTYSEIEIKDETSENSVKITVLTDCDSYYWEFDGAADSQTGNSFTKDVSEFSAGTYEVYLEAAKDGNLYSYFITVEVSDSSNYGAQNFGATTTIPASGGTVNGEKFESIDELVAKIADHNFNETATLVLGSNVSESDLSRIGNALQNKNSGTISLDLSGCTNISKIGSEFSNKQALSSIILPSNLEEIGENAFANCQVLTSVIFPNDSKLKTISAQAFVQVTNLTTISLPASLETIDANAFNNCGSLTLVEFLETSNLKSIGVEAFKGTQLTEITFPASLTKISQNAFLNVSTITSATFKDTSKTWTLTQVGNAVKIDYDVSDSGANATNLTNSAIYPNTEWTRND